MRQLSISQRVRSCSCHLHSIKQGSQAPYRHRQSQPM
ncbi:ankyrin repeat and BTB/POZ domain protein [Aspergillus luchuensis]|uniref:Ankyrin repeat and BTB/POZ domain protein n=1 Tax=Aspergillus kawachii TaxID=1069201 RepID=A0A146F3E3_ASPKA|nr:ankyrin repeat and BTB/POZ domain protein [Aspergillus luchuensis]